MQATLSQPGAVRSDLERERETKKKTPIQRTHGTLIENKLIIHRRMLKQEYIGRFTHDDSGTMHTTELVHVVHLSGTAMDLYWYVNLR